jgi:hypothetical protein
MNKNNKNKNDLNDGSKKVMFNENHENSNQ